MSVALSSHYITREEDETTLHHSDTTLILFNGRNYALKSLTITQDSNHPGNFDHDITIYQHEAQCDTLPSHNEKRTIKKSNIHPANKLSPIYMLADSNITFIICGSTNQSRPTERLELALVHGLDSLQYYSPSLHNYMYLHFSYIIPGSNGEWDCKNIIFPIKKDGYYTTIFLTEPKSASFNYSLTYFRYYFDISHFESVENHTLHKDKDNATYGDNPHKYCYAATIHKRPGLTTRYVHIRITYEYYTMRFFADNYQTLIAFPLVLIVAIIVVESIAIVLVKLRELRCTAGT